MRNYWANRRRKEAEKGKPVKISSRKEIEFRIDEKIYTYVYQTTSNTGFGYIFIGNAVTGQKIYGPYETDRTDEGCKVYELLQESKLI